MKFPSSADVSSCCDADCFYKDNGTDAIVFNKTTLRVVGFFALLLSIVQLGFGSYVSDYFVNYKVGTWWAGLVCGATAICAIVATPLSVISTTVLLAVASFVVAITSAALNGTSYTFIESLATCAEQGTWKIIGETDYSAEAVVCLIENPSYKCACVQPKTDSRCFDFELTDAVQNTCSDIMAYYPDYQLVSLVLSVALALLMVAMVLFSYRTRVEIKYYRLHDEEQRVLQEDSGADHSVELSGIAEDDDEEVV